MSDSLVQTRRENNFTRYLIVVKSIIFGLELKNTLYLTCRACRVYCIHERLSQAYCTTIYIHAACIAEQLGTVQSFKKKARTYLFGNKCGHAEVQKLYCRRSVASETYNSVANSTAQLAYSKQLESSNVCTTRASQAEIHCCEFIC